MGLEGVLTVSGRCFEVSGKGLEGILKGFGRGLNGIWKVSKVVRKVS